MVVVHCQELVESDCCCSMVVMEHSGSVVVAEEADPIDSFAATVKTI